MAGPDAARSPIDSIGDRPAVVAVDAALLRERHADELVAALCAAAAGAGATGTVGATHWADDGSGRRIALTIGATGLSDAALLRVLERALEDRADPAAVLASGPTGGSAPSSVVLEDVLRAHRDRASGRVVVASGLAAVPDTTTVGRLLEATAVDRVVQLAAGDADPAATLRTRGHLRPRWREGRLVLDVQPAAGGALVPFEVPDPTPCCAAHA